MGIGNVINGKKVRFWVPRIAEKTNDSNNTSGYTSYIENKFKTNYRTDIIHIQQQKTSISKQNIIRIIIENMHIQIRQEKQK